MTYYETNFDQFIKSTIKVDMTELYNMFSPLVVSNGKILDLGCGPGRDLKYFKDQGHNCLGLEPSQKLAEFGRSHSGCEIIESTIQDFESNEVFDGIWACASLLHLETDELKAALKKISKFMHSDSVFYSSFKYGDYEGVRNERFFNDQTLESIELLLPREMFIVKHWLTDDKRPDRGERWLNLLIHLKSD